MTLFKRPRTPFAANLFRLIGTLSLSLSRCAVIFAAIASATTLAQELDDMDTERSMIEARLGSQVEAQAPDATDANSSSSWRVNAVRIAFWAYRCLHSSALPGFMSSAIVTAILTDDGGTAIYSGINVVFSFMALLFISNFDETLAYLVLPTTEIQRCEEIHGVQPRAQSVRHW